MKRSSKIAIILGIVSIVFISAVLTVHFRLSETEKSEIQSGAEQNEKESASQVAHEIVNSLQNKPETEQNENAEQDETLLPSYVKIVDGVQVVTIDANEFKFTPSEIHLNSGDAKFVIVNNGKTEHEFVVYEVSKKDIVDKAEQTEDEETIKKNVLFEIEEIKAGKSNQSDVMNLKEGLYVVGCHIAGHYDAGMHGTITVE